MPTTVSGTDGVDNIKTGTVTQADMATGVAGTGPAFGAYQSVAQSLTSTNARINLQTEEFDTASCFDSTTNSRFTPNVAGYYQISGGLAVSTSVTQVTTSIYKNGAIFKTGFNTAVNAGSGVVSSLVYLNGTTDYVELWGSFLATQNTSATQAATWFNGFLARAA